MKAIAQSTGRDMKQLKLDYVKCGDLGTVAKVNKEIDYLGHLIKTIV